MRKHYKARDKTVRKMSRDGLMKENLRSGESVSVSRREKDSLTLSKRAGDAWNRRGNKRTDNQKWKCAVDLKKPDSCSSDVKVTGVAKADSTFFGEQQGEPGGTDNSFNGRKRPQPARIEKTRGNSPGNVFQQQAAQPFCSRYEKAQSTDVDDTVKDVPNQTMPGGTGNSSDERKRRKSAGGKKACGNSVDNNFQQQSAQIFDSGHEIIQTAQLFYDGDEKTQPADMDDTVKNVPDQKADKEARVLARPSRMENVQRHSSRSSGFVSAVAEAGFTRKKRRVQPSSQSGKCEPKFSKVKKNDGACSKKGNGRHSAAEERDKDVQGENAAIVGNQDAALPEKSHDEKRDAPMRERLYKNQRRKLFYHPVRDKGSEETAGAAAESSGSQAVEVSGNNEREKARHGDYKNQKKKASRLIFEDKDKSDRDAASKSLGMSRDAEKGRQGQKHKRKGQKKLSRLSFDDEDSRMVRGSGMGIAKKAVFLAAHSAADYAHGSGQEQEYGAVDGARKAALEGQGAIRYAVHTSSRRKLKRTSRLREVCVEKRGGHAEKMDAERSGLQHRPKQGTAKNAASESSAGIGQAKKNTAKRWQKQRIKKSYQAARQKGRTAAVAQVAQTFFTKTRYVAVETFRKDKGIFGAAAALILLFAAVSVGMSGCGAMLQGAASSIIGTTYPSSDADIYAVESDYAALEDALDSQINSMESTHPGFDEYLYQVDEIPHSPYQLVSYFSAKYGGFTYEQVADEIEEIFQEQYHLYVDEAIETVTETKTVRVGESLGPVVTSGYCNCQICCGIWSGGPTSSGVYPTAGHTLAVDASDPFVPVGTKVVMNGVEYVVEDTGSFASHGVQFDVYYADHAAAVAHGHQTWEAYLVDSSGGREVEVATSKEVKCLKVTLTNRGLDAVLRRRMDENEEKRYDLYNLTYGNRHYLFDTGRLPTGGGADGGYEAPAETLSDAGVARMIQEAEKYLGFPYVWGGSSPATSFDCSGFVSWVVNNCGNGWNVGRQTAEGLRGCCTYIPPADAKPGDLIFFQGTYNTPGASHVGIYVGNDTMIHCGNPIQYSNINSQYWKLHFLEFGRMQ